MKAAHWGGSAAWLDPKRAVTGLLSLQYCIFAFPRSWKLELRDTYSLTLSLFDDSQN
jgi:hypothetical protein